MHTPTIALNSLPEETLRRLQKLAESDNRELGAEALDCLERGIREREETERNSVRIRALHLSMPNARLTDELIREAKSERKE